MKIKEVHLVSFSPCGHTLTYGRQMAMACVEVAGQTAFREWNVTPLAANREIKAFSATDLVLLCAPVFGGRIPGPAIARFRNLQASHTPVILVITYGNRAYDDALLEFVDIAREQGFWPVGAAACIAQHTLVGSCAAGRPNELDLDSAKDFATEISAMIASDAIDLGGSLSVPGNSPYREYKPFPLPQTVNDNCILCGQCWTNCPTGAIAIDLPGAVAKELCIACMCCITICPVGARIPDEKFLQTVSEKITPLCSVDKQNEYFSL